ncbi:ion transporter [Salinicola halophilus]|uniref:ion transporter n=1 Tax=Salinicola halophilus TaxID=184065 RepID=UPI0023B87653|nr:ion transporter [Salinicola halophilus]
MNASRMKESVTPFQFFVLALSFYVLGALVADTFFSLPQEITRLLGYMDYVVCAVFFVDFCQRFYRAPNKWRYMRWGWLDLLACIPAGWFQAARLARVVQVLRVLRALRSLELIWQLLFRNRAEGVLASAATATVLLVIFGALTVLMVETPNPDSPINTAEEALWWAIVTVTTVGYGDYYPITTLGRVVAVLLMVCGVGLFGSFAAYVGSLFVEDQSESDSRQHKANRRMMRHMIEQVSELQQEIEALREELRTYREERHRDTGESTDDDRP